MFRFILLCLFSFNAIIPVFAQNIFKGKIIDAGTKEPVAGATIHCSKEDCRCGCVSNSNGDFEMRCTDCQTITISYIGYNAVEVALSSEQKTVELSPATTLMNTVVVSASRGELVKRSEAPIAIATISQKTVQETKATTIDQLLNKVSGVNMVSLGNEEHQMSIRQPMTTKSLFLYLEDGIPVRTTGLFNHNALLEMNMAATKNIEVIKGPSSSLYGSEAIGGVVNFISVAPTIIPQLKLSIQGSSLGYKRSDLQSSFISGKWGVAVNGYYGDRHNSFQEYTDYHKGIITARIDYRFSDKTLLSNSLTAMNYYSDMPSGVDSTLFAQKSVTSLQTFTYRKVTGVRAHTTLTQNWNEQGKTTLSAAYRNNLMEQNPNYRIKDDFKKVAGVWTGNKALAHGEINASRFSSYVFLVQHRQKTEWLKTIIHAGISADLSPSAYDASYIRIAKDTISRKYQSFVSTDSLLTNYTTRINNYAAFASFETSPVEKLRIVASLRYDLFHYDFHNALKPSSFSGAADTINSFRRFSPKIGFTYNFSLKTGVYVNYSEGFVPPQVTELFTGVKVPYLSSSVFYNYEIGGWAELVKDKLCIDASIYELKGTNEVISVKLEDGSFANQNAGQTIHRGIELGMNAQPLKELTVRVSGAYSKHQFKNYIEKGNPYNGNEMSNAPNWLCNMEAWYRPAFAKGLRIGGELQYVGPYFADPANTARYKGYAVMNLRTGYALKNFDVWMNIMNVTNAYYSYITTKSTSGWSYQLSEPLNITLGVSYRFENLFRK